MATFDSTTHPLAFSHMEGGLKTVYVVPAIPEFRGMSSGDRLEFDDLGYITVGTIRRYDSVDELLEAEGYANVIPEADSQEQAASVLQDSSGWRRDLAEKHGVLALRVRAVKRSGA